MRIFFINWNIIISKLCKYIEPLQSNRNTIEKHPYRILLVDDEHDITLTFSIVLEDNGFVVDSFNDPLLALSSLKHGLYALALIDIKMPKMNGFDLYREIRKLDDKVKVCFMTAFDIKKEDIEAAIPTSNEEKPTIFRKPIKLEDLVSGVKAELENWLVQSAIYATPYSEGLAALASGFSIISKDDYDNMAKQFYVYDALYAFCKSNDNKEKLLISRH